VIETHPLVDGVPFPTLYWLTCRRASQAVGSLEAAGKIGEINERISSDASFRADVAAAAADYVSRRDAHHRLAGAGGIGGGRDDHVKCLHAHLAHHLVCGCNPVGAWVLEQIGPLLGGMHEPPCV
jgi:hypothetical protein